MEKSMPNQSETNVFAESALLAPKAHKSGAAGSLRDQGYDTITQWIVTSRLKLSGKL